jgi:putative heme-binding domain-containing protein
MEVNPAATRTLLAAANNEPLAAESRLLGILALGGRDAARGIAQLGPTLGRPPTEEEIRILALGTDDPDVKRFLAGLLNQPTLRVPTLRALLAVRHTFATSPLQTNLTGATNALLGGTVAEVTLGAEAAGAFQLAACTPALVAALEAHAGNVALASAILHGLRETGTAPIEPLAKLLADPTRAKLHDDAVAALATSNAPAAPAHLIGLFAALTPRARGIALERLSDRPEGARALLTALNNKQLKAEDLGLGTAERMRAVLPTDPAVAALHAQLGGGARRVLRLPGGPADFPEATVSLRGTFTVECWLRLDADINGRDGIIGAPSQFDVNFFDGRLRVWLPEANDVIVASRPAAPGAWTHYAVTRDERGVFRLYLNGELEGTSAPTSNLPLTDLRVARSRTNPAGGVTGGAIDEYRVWSVARTAEEIRAAFDRTFADLATAERPAGLQRVLAGADWGLLSGGAKAINDDEAPELLTRRSAAEQDAKFARFRVLAAKSGNATRGRELFTSICLACHQQGGRGGNLAPALDGVGLTGTEALLRNILTPNAAMESAYRIYRVTTRDGRVHEGFLAEDSPAGVVLRFPGAEERKLARSEIQSAGFLRRSLMPEGILEALPETDVSDLFAHLRALR